MTRQTVSKVNHFMVSAPQGIVLTTKWLEGHGVSPKLAWWYLHAGLLERIASKAYKKAGDTVSWVGALAAVQQQLMLPIHLGGKSALQLLGLSQYIPLHGMKNISVFTHPMIRIPIWLDREDLWKTDFRVFKTSLFPELIDKDTLIERNVDSLNVKLSCPERAMMEILYLVPSEEDFDEAVLLFEGLGQLRPKIIQLLLENCHSIKVKRVFLYLSEKIKHEWFLSLDMNKINLGRGKRVIGQGGYYDKKYMLSVPIPTEDYDENR